MALSVRSLSAASASSRSAVAPVRVASAPRQIALRRPLSQPVRALEIDLSDPDTQIALAGVVLGVVAGFGAPLWYINRIEADDERLEELRALNRANYEATGEYMTDAEISQMRKPKWTDRKEFQDDD